MYEAGQLQSHPKLLEPDGYHGVLITNTQPADDAYLADVSLPCASVIIGRKIKGKNCVFEKPGFIGTEAARLLMEVKGKASLVLYGKPLTPITSDRLETFEKAILKGTGSAPIQLPAEALTPQAAARALTEFFNGGGRCDGIFLVTDYMGPGVYDVLKEHHLRIPQDVLVVGVGDHDPASLYFNPPLVVASENRRSLVEKSIPLLFRQLDGKLTTARQVSFE